MNIDEDKIREIVGRLLNVNNLNEVKCDDEIPMESSARHVHLCQSDVDKLFGLGHKLTPVKDLSQPGQYLCEERVKLVTEKSEINNVALLGPVRSRTQVEISASDARFLGVNPPIRISGKLNSAEDIIIISGKKVLEAKECVIIAQNHIHMTPEDAEKFRVADGDCVQVKVISDRSIIFDNVPIRVDKNSKIAMHIDLDEANACNLTKVCFGKVLSQISN